MESRAAIRKWMKANVEEHRDSVTGEINCTSMVEAWDTECSTGEATLDMEHPAWDIAVEVSEWVEGKE